MIPLAGLIWRARGLFLLAEAIFTIIFYAFIKMITDIYDILLWSRESLELAGSIRKARLKENANVRSVRHRAKKRDEDLDAYRTNDNAKKQAWSATMPKWSSRLPKM
jgi:hypothetical protein